MAGEALEDYLGRVDASAVRVVTALDDAVRAAHPALDVAIKYRMLMYALDGDWRTWVCAIDVTRKGVSLRFLYGVLLDDPMGVLRSGSSVLETWDLGVDADVDAAAVAAYVREAVAAYPRYKADAPAIEAAAKAAGPRRRRPGRPGTAPAGG